METKECIHEKGMALREEMIDIVNNLGVAHTCHNFHKDNVFTYRCLPTPLAFSPVLYI